MLVVALYTRVNATWIRTLHEDNCRAHVQSVSLYMRLELRRSTPERILSLLHHRSLDTSSATRIWTDVSCSWSDCQPPSSTHVSHWNQPFLPHQVCNHSYIFSFDRWLPGEVVPQPAKLALATGCIGCTWIRRSMHGIYTKEPLRYS